MAGHLQDFAVLAANSKRADLQQSLHGDHCRADFHVAIGEREGIAVVVSWDKVVGELQEVEVCAAVGPNLFGDVKCGNGGAAVGLAAVSLGNDFARPDGVVHVGYGPVYPVPQGDPLIGVLDAQHLKDGGVQLTPVVEVEFIGQVAARITLSDLVAGSNRPLGGFQ